MQLHEPDCRLVHPLAHPGGAQPRLPLAHAALPVEGDEQPLALLGRTCGNRVPGHQSCTNLLASAAPCPPVGGPHVAPERAGGKSST